MPRPSLKNDSLISAGSFAIRLLKLKATKQRLFHAFWKIRDQSIQCVAGASRGSSLGLVVAAADFAFTCNGMQQCWHTAVTCNQRSLGVSRKLFEHRLEAGAGACPFLRRRVIPKRGEQLVAIIHSAIDAG